MAKKQFDIIKEIEKIKQCLCCMGLDCKTNISKWLSLPSGKETQVLTLGANDTMYWNDTRYVHSCVSADFVASSITIPRSVHKRGPYPIVQAHEDFSPMLKDTDITIQLVNNGDVKVTVIAPFVTGFNGKVIIM